MTDKFFAAANSSGGFVCWFDEIFSPDSFDKIYIIKGGSGTGKSTLMKKIARRAIGVGYRCEYFYCSSDPDSLDGIALTTDAEHRFRRIAVIDGTSPHLRDPKLPGAVEEIYNLGEFWDTGALREHRETIARLCREKSRLYSEAYEFLYAAGEIEKLLRTDAASFILAEKLQSAAERVLTQAVRSARRSGFTLTKHKPSVKIRPVSAISTKGAVSFDTYRTMPGRLCVVADVMGTAPFMFDALLDAAGKLGLDAVRAPMPLEPELTEAIYLPELRLSVVRSEEAPDNDTKILNMARFIDRDAVSRSDRQRRRLLHKCSRELLDGAFEKLAGVRAVHGGVEKIYIAAMNFEAVDKSLDKLMSELF